MKKTTFAAILLCTILAGCGQQTQSGNVTASTESTATVQNVSDKSVMGRITAIDGDTITLETMGGGMHGQPPAGKPDGEKSEDSTTTATDSSSDASSTDQASADGTQPQNGKNRVSETVTCKLTDDCTVWTESQGAQTSASAADLKVGDNIQITYADDGESVDSIVIKPEMQQGQGKGPDKGNNTTSASSSAASDKTAETSAETAQTSSQAQ